MQRISLRSAFVFGLCLVVARFTCPVVASEKVTPPLNVESIARTGEVIFHTGTIVHRAAIHLAEEIKFGADGAYSLTPGYYLRTSEGVGWEYYSPATGPNGGGVKKSPGSITVQGSFHYSNNGKTIGMITNFYQAINTKAKGITRTTRPSFSRDRVQRSLIYHGLSGAKVMFSYRETWKNIDRPSGDILLEYDLAESHVVEIRGARIEIIEADDQTIRYRIKRAFNLTETSSEE